MGKTLDLLGGVLGWCKELLIEGSEHVQRIQKTLKELDVGSYRAHGKPQAQGLVYELRNLGILPINETYFETRLGLIIGHETCIQCRAVFGAVGHGETGGTGGGTWNTNPTGTCWEASFGPGCHTSGDFNGNEYSRPRRRGQGDDGRPPPRLKKTRLRAPTAGSPFACPFYRHNEQEHYDCLRYKLERISDVRLHIRRCHAQPSQCPRCGAVFQNDDTYAQRDAHIIQQSCPVNIEFFQPSGATSEQLESMRNAANRRHGANDVERWYTIWRILFPSAASRRPSPYIDDVAWEWRNNTVRAYLDNGGLQNFNRQNTSGLGALLSATLTLFLEHFRDYNAVSAVAVGSHDHDNTHSNMMGEAQSVSWGGFPVLSPLPEHPSLTLRPNLDIDEDDDDGDDDDNDDDDGDGDVEIGP